MKRRLGVRELRGQLSAAVSAASGGEHIAITVRGRPVATLGPVGDGPTDLTLESLAATGLIEPPRRRDRPKEPHPHVLPADIRLDRVLDQVRGRT